MVGKQPTAPPPPTDRRLIRQGHTHLFPTPTPPPLRVGGLREQVRDVYSLAAARQQFLLREVNGQGPAPLDERGGRGRSAPHRGISESEAPLTFGTTAGIPFNIASQAWRARCKLARRPRQPVFTRT